MATISKPKSLFSAGFVAVLLIVLQQRRKMTFKILSRAISRKAKKSTVVARSILVSVAQKISSSRGLVFSDCESFCRRHVIFQIYCVGSPT